MKCSHPCRNMSVSATIADSKNYKGENKVDYRTNKLLGQSFDDKILSLKSFPNSKNVIFSDGWYQLKNDASHLGYWTDGNGVIQLKSDHDGNAKISFRIGTASQKNSIHLAVNGQSLENLEIEQNFEIVKNMRIRLNAGINIFEISSEENWALLRKILDSFALEWGISILVPHGLVLGAECGSRR